MQWKQPSYKILDLFLPAPASSNAADFDTKLTFLSELLTRGQYYAYYELGFFFHAIDIHTHMNWKGTDWLDQMKCKETGDSMNTDKKKMLQYFSFLNIFQN